MKLTNRIQRMQQQGFLRSPAALLFGLFLLVFAHFSQASMIVIIGDQARATVNEIPRILTAEALVTATLVDHNEAAVEFDQTSVTLGEGLYSSVTLNITNTGINNLESGTVILTFPDGVIAVFPPNPLYTAEQQPDGSWLITLAGTLAPGMAIAIDLQLSAETGTTPGTGEMVADFSANDVSIRGTMVQIIIGEPVAGLFLTHAVDKSLVSADEVLRYTLTVANPMQVDVTTILLNDALPFGVIFLPGSVTLNGLPVADPVLGANGRTLVFSLGTLPAGETATISFLGFVTATTPVGELLSTATAIGDNASSNSASARSVMQRDLMADDSHIVGRVLADACEASTEDTGEIRLFMSSKMHNSEIEYTIFVEAGDELLENFSINASLPSNLSYIPGSTELDDRKYIDPQLDGKNLRFLLGQLEGRWQKTITFRVLPDLQQPGQFETTANATYEIKGYGRLQSPRLGNTYRFDSMSREFRTFIYRPDYSAVDAGMPDIDRKKLSDLTHAIQGRVIRSVNVTGYSGPVPKEELERSPYPSEKSYSERLARLVADALAEEYVIDRNNIKIIGKGAEEPLNSNDRDVAKEMAIGIQNNRRVELRVEMLPLGADTRQQEIFLGEESSVKSPLYARRTHLPARITTETRGVSGVRLLMEDGRFVDTDAAGSYHFEGLKPGTHVVQIDPASVPDGYELYSCVNNSRFAKTPTSQFIDLTKGLVWRADFHLRSVVNLFTSRSGIKLSSAVTEDDEGNKKLHYRAFASGSAMPQGSGNLLLQLPEGVELDKDSVRRNGVAVTPLRRDEFWQVQLSAMDADWQQLVEFDASIKTEETRSYSTFAQMEITLKGKGTHYSRRVSNELAIEKAPLVREQRFEFGTHFENAAYKLSPVDIATLDRFAKQFRGQDIESLRIIGHTDNRQLRNRMQKELVDNQHLSELRAHSVADYLRDRMSLSDNQLIVIGKGELEPVASNETEEGRTKNRRVEIRVRASANEYTLIARMVVPESPFEEETLNLKAREVSEREVTRQPEQLPEGILSLQEGEVVPVPTASIRLNIDSRLLHKLYVDDVEVPESRIGFRKANELSHKTIYTYFGVNMGKPGEHRLSVKGTDSFGNVRFSQSVSYHRSGEVKEIRFIGADGNIADGKTPVTARIAMFDEDGKEINAPIDLLILSGQLQPWEKEGENALPELTDGNRLVSMDRDGVLKFKAVNKSGLYRMKLQYNGLDVSVNIYVTPQYRDWVLVGVADGVAGYADVAGNMEGLDSNGIEEDFYQDGKLAFYAKGKIKGKYLLTLAFDSSREKQDERLLQLINPDEYYTLYGDHSEQQFDAASREKLYLRIEGDKFYAMFGDYETDLTVTELSRYSRSFTGAKGVYESGQLSVNAFAAQTDQMFTRDEILGDGTSGLYHLSRENIVVNSEKVRIEVRDRFHSERIISEKQLNRFADYNLDYTDGTLYFKEPIQRHDDSFNPVYIVVDYESVNVNREDIVAGGRASVKMADDRVEVGLTHIDEGIEGFEGQLTGVDLRYDITGSMQLKAEIAASELDTSGTTTDASAYLAELLYKTDRFDATVYARETEPGFGIGQQNVTEEGTGKYGAMGSRELAEDLELSAEIGHEDNETSQSSRNALSTRLTYDPDPWKFDLGATVAEDKDSLGDKFRSETLNTGAARYLLDKKVRLYGRSEWVLNSADSNNLDYPERHLLGADYAITDSAALFSEYEFANTDAYRAESLRAGIKSTPWANASMSNSVQRDQGEFDERTFAVFGLTQSVPLSEHWKASFSFDQTDTIDHRYYTRVNSNVPVTSGSSQSVLSTNGAIDEDFWATTAGIGYDSELYLFDSRLEYRNAESHEKTGIFTSWQRNLLDGVGHALRLKAFDTDYTQLDDEFDAELRYSSVYRPLGAEWFVFNRSELKYLKVDGAVSMASDSQVEKLVEHLALNYQPSLDWQAALHAGYKQTRTDAASLSFVTDTWLLGSEIRHDLSDLWDVGAHYHIITTPDFGLTEDSYGFSVGVDLAKNLWLSMGYNFEGYSDDDFDANGYTAKGIFLKLRFKFDQDTFNLNDND